MSSSSKVSRLTIFIVFLTVNLIASVINHIDDTDETYGYWEPLHYLLFGDGMQTWEYSPTYAIRTYSFIYPVFLLGRCLQIVISDKITLFYLVRASIGIFSAYSQTKFVASISNKIGLIEGRLTMMFLLCSPGIFFSSTSYLPSAFAMNCVMNSSAAFLESSFLLSVLWGCFAVLWSGWPFVAVLFVPLGVCMLYETAVKKSIIAVATLILQVCVLLVISLVPVVLIDRFYYQKWYVLISILKIVNFLDRTSPALNILLYNAIGGSGDELYGIEPVSYYIRNLFLNTGLAWVLTLLVPFVNILEWYVQPTLYYARANVRTMSLTCLAVLWLGILFSRPHKEERFMYPIYPILALISSQAVYSAGRVIDAVTHALWKKANKSKDVKLIPRSKLTYVMIVGISVVAALLFVSRVTSNYINYRGYMGLWKKTHVVTSLLSNAQMSVNVCTGSEWYHFPSHFFLPNNALVQYIEDGFKGVLPQHFAPIQGTSAQPLQPFNDRNQEERSRYVTAESCDYVILLVDHNKPRDEQEGAMRAQLAEPLEDSMFAMHQEIWFPSQRSQKYLVAGEERVISAEYSKDSLARAFYIPGYSEKRVKFQSYYLLKRIS